jgi:hypothetical protein
VAVDQESGRFVDVSDRVPGRWANVKQLRASWVLKRLPGVVGAWGILGSVGIGAWHAWGAGPRRKPRGRPRPAEDVRYRRAFRRRRIVAEHATGRLRRARAAADVSRRKGRTRRVRAVAGSINRMLDHRSDS